MHNRIDVPAHLLPGPGALMLLLRAALAPTLDGSPFLAIQRIQTGVYRTYVTVHRPGEHTDGALMLTGPEALTHAYFGGWDSVIDPTAGQLRSLAMYAVKVRDLITWEEDFDLWQLNARTAIWNEREAMRGKEAHAGAMLARDRWAR